MTLPTGRVTFLFSDIEGSTRHAHRLGDAAWASLLATHDRLIDDAVAAHHGVVVKHEGDGTFAVFPDADQAAGAAIDIARGLHEGADVRVRIGLHTGEGRTTEGGTDYVGIDVHYAARVSAAGNGGQIVISETTRDGLADVIDATGATVVDEGPRKLKDFDDPRPLFRIVVPGVIDDARPLRTEDLPSNLPSMATSFVGRDAEIERLATVLLTARLLTLTGPGGTGKTRLALGLGEVVRSRFRGGTWFVDLAPVRDPGLIVGSIAEALGVHEEPGVPIATTLREHLRPIEALLILDNLEQLLPAASATISALLREAPGVRLAVTSREILRVAGEQEYAVPPLAGDEGVTLFLDRARARRMDIGDSAADREVAQRIVDRLGGLPLAIELAAARTRLMSPEGILDRLGQSLDVLSGGARDLPERQRTLRGTVAWSHDLLDTDERVVFRRSAVFNGGWTADAATAVVDPSGSLSMPVLDGLESLADKSLVRVEITEHGEPRFERHVLIREYALEQLADAGERGDCERRHAMTYLAVAEDAGPHLVGEDAARWLDLVAHEEHNLRTAMRWSIDVGEPEVGMRIAGAIWRFWQHRTRMTEGLAWTADLLDAGTAAEAAATETAAAEATGTEETATRLVVARLAALSADAGMAYWNRDFDRCRRRYQERLDLAVELGDDRQSAEAHYEFGFLGMVENDPDLLRHHEQIALELFERVGDRGGAVRARQALVIVHFLTRDFAAARELEVQNLAEFKRMGAAYRYHDSLVLLAAASIFEDDLDIGRGYLRESTRLTSGVLTDQISAVAMAAHLAMRSGREELGARLAGAADAASDELGVTNASLEILHVDPADAARERLGDRADALIAEGRTMSLDEALVVAAELIGTD